MTPLPDYAVTAGMDALFDALDFAVCQGDTRDHAPNPVYRERHDNSYDTWIEHGARAVLEAATEQIRCRRCNGHKHEAIWDPPDDWPTTYVGERACLDCGGAGVLWVLRTRAKP